MRFRKWFIPVFFSLVLVLLVWIAVSDHSPVWAQDQQNNHMQWETGWQAEETDGSFRAISFPQRLRAGETTIVNTLPDSIHPLVTYLYIKSNYQQVTIEVGGTQVPACCLDAGAAGHDLPWTRVQLTPEMEGQTVRLTFSGTGSKPYIEVYSARLGSNSKIRLALFSHALPTIILCLLIVLFALSLSAFATLEARRYRKRMPSGYLHLMAFALLAGVWAYTDSDISGVHYIGSQAFFYFNLYSYMLLPLPFFLFVYAQNKSLRKITVALGLVTVANILVQIALLLAGRFVAWISMLATNSVLLIACAVMPFLIRRLVDAGQRSEELTLGIMITSVVGSVSIILFYLYPIENNSMVFSFGIIVLVITLTISILRTNVDIFAQAKRIEQLRIREEEYRIAVRQSDKYVLRYDVASRTLLKGEVDSPLVLADQEVAGLPENLIASGGVAKGSEADFREMFREIHAGKPAGICALNMRNQDGGFAWYHFNYTLIFTDDGQPSQAVISFYDITEQRTREIEYQKWKQSYTELPTGAISYYEYNLTLNAFIGEAGELWPPLPQTARNNLRATVDYLADHYVYPEDNQRFRAFLLRKNLMDTFRKGIYDNKLEFRRKDGDGQPLWTLAHARMIVDPFSGDTQFSLLLQDEDDQKRNAMNAAAGTDTDAITGLLNRAAFKEKLGRVLEQTGPSVTHALMMIDLDGFKRINDTFGHQFGDRVLMEIAKSLRAMMRSGDLIGRNGGDEYIICLCNIRDESGFLEKRAAFICQALNQQFGNDVGITGSIGIALCPQDGRTVEVLYQKADMALYYAKHHGKNRSIFFHDGLMRGESGDAASYGIGWSEDGKDGEQAPDTPERMLLILDLAGETGVFLRSIFQSDYRMMLAGSEAECVAMIEKQETPVSALLLNLSGEADLAMLDRLQNREDTASIPVIVTAEDSELGLKAIELGATDFVSKPFTPRLVRLRVKNAIRKQETEELRAQNRYLLMQKNDENRHQNELRYIAEHDPLTSICNKAAFYDKTRQMLDRSPDVTFVMITFDIEKFRLINDIFGHEEGDRLLRYIAQRMQTLYAGFSTYSRIDADNFAMCLPYDQQTLRKQLAENDREMREYDLPFEVLLVYGLYVIDDRTLPVNIMHDRAEMAKRNVKGNYFERYAYYDDKLRKALLNEQQIVNDINEALRKKQLEIYLQPKCLINTGEIVGAEALVRWNHPTRGLMMPGLFVPIFEKNGFIMKMDVYVWEQVCILIRRWMDLYGGKPPIPVSMNISRVDIYNPALVSILCRLAERYNVPRRYMELEITESAYTENRKQLSELISTLRREGFTVEMDDFGSAYSSLNMLKEISVDTLKLDMRFLYGSDPDGRGGTILNSIVRMARYLSLPIVAEGVETVEQARFLASIGCSVGQGFFYYRPMPVADFERLLMSHPLKPLNDVEEVYPEAAVRRVWSIDGDFSLMLSTIPCAASLCEFNGGRIELLRINEEYLVMTGDKTERLYNEGTNVRSLTTEEDYRQLQGMLQEACNTKGFAEGLYHRCDEQGNLKLYKVKIKFLTGDDIRSLFFITYWPLRADGEGYPSREFFDEPTAAGGKAEQTGSNEHPEA